MSFDGFHPDAAAFYAELRKNNTKAWWQENRARYDEHVRGPFEALAEHLEPEFGAAKIFRPYRDVRFSADKTPYKVHIGMVTRSPAAHYLQFSDEGVFVGGGMYDVSPAVLRRFREIVDDNRLVGDLEASLDDVGNEGFEIMRDGALKTAPRGFPADHPHIDLLRLKRLAVGRREPLSDWMWTPEAFEIVRDRWRTVSIWCAWMEANLGEPQQG